MVFTGLVVGGHLAGEWRSHDLPEFAESHFLGGQVEMPDGNTLFWDGPPTSSAYVHVTAGSFAAFWVPEGKDAAWALAELAQCYRAKKKD
jgi:hypothetical protein